MVYKYGVKFCFNVGMLYYCLNFVVEIMEIFVLGGND